jgi:hypothetical protein
MRVRLAFKLAIRLQGAVMWLLDYGCRHSKPPMDLSTELAKQLINMTTVYVMSPEQFDPPAEQTTATKH